jgi:hypothetical protein
MDDPLADLPASRLAWNSTNLQFYFHYTTRVAAQIIRHTARYEVSRRHARSGMYVTDLAPGSRSSIQLLNVLCDGTRDVERTQAVVVIARDGPIAFDRPKGMTAPNAWYHAADPGTVLDLRLQVAGWGAKEAGVWRLSRALFI